MADWDVVGTAPAQVQNPWAVRKIAPPTFAESQNATAATHQPTGDLSGVLSGLAELFGTSLANIPGGAMHGIHDIVSRATGNGPAPAYKPDFVPSPNAQAVGESISQNTPHVPTVGDLLNLIPGVKEFHDQYIAPVEQDVSQVAAGAGIAAPIAAPILRAGATALEGSGAASEAGQLGLRTGGTGGLSNVAAGAAGDEGRAAVSHNNVTNATRVAGNQVGVPADVPVTPTSLDAAKVLPGKVLDDAAASLPTAPLSPAAAAQVQAARPTATITPPTPNVQNRINQIESSLLDPDAKFTGQQIRATRNSLSSDATAGANSPDADTRALSQYQRKVVSALDQHVADTLPANGPHTLDQVNLARQTLAQNYTVGDLLKGPYMDLKGLGKIHADSPNLLTGDLRTLGQFAVDHPEVSGLPPAADRFAPPGYASGLGQALGANQHGVGSRLSNIFGVPTVATRMLTGDTDAAAAAARARPVTGLGGEFAPRAAEAPGAAISGGPSPPQGGPPATAVPTAGITATPITHNLGDLNPKQRGAVGEPVNIGPLRALQNQPQTYKNGPIEIPKGAAKKPEAANDKKFGPFRGNPQTLEDFLRENLGDNF